MHANANRLRNNIVQEQKIRVDLLISVLIILSLAILIGLIFWKTVPLTALMHASSLLLPNVILLTILMFAAFGPGALALRLIGFRDNAHPEFFLFSTALGLGILAHLILLIGVLKLFFSSVIWVLLFTGSLLSIFELIKHRHQYKNAIKGIKYPQYIHWFSLLLIVLLIINWGYSIFSTALLPPFNSDEVAYHLAIPKIYIQNHAISYIPFIPYSNWPLETEMLFTLSLLIPSEILAHLVEWSAMVLICIGIFLYGRKYFNSQAGLFGAVLFASTPMVITLSGSSLIESSLTLYTFLATMTLYDWIQTGEKKFWVLSALFGGLAASTKLNAALVPLILGVTMFGVSLASKKINLTKAITQLISYGLLAFLIVFPWYIKSWILAGNPIWPFLYPILGGKNWDLLGSEYLLGFIQKPNMSLTPINWLAGLWNLSAHPLWFGPNNVRIGWLYIIFLSISLLMLLFSKRDLRIKLAWLAVIGILFYTSWFLQTHQSRFLMPSLPIFALFAAGGITGLWLLNNSGIWRTMFQIGIFVCLLMTCWITNPDDRELLKSRWPYLSGNITRDEFLSSQIPGYETIMYANSQLKEDVDIWLGLFEPRGYYLDKNYMWANPISQRVIRLEQYQNVDQLVEALHKLGLTHILFRMTNLDKYTYIRYSENDLHLVTALLNSPHVQQIFQSADLGLYQLRP